MSDIDEWVIEGIEKAKNERPLENKKVIRTRYPYTYAYDFVRSHPGAFGLDGAKSHSRADVARIVTEKVGGDGIRTYSEAKALEVCIQLADAYIEEQGLVWE